VRIVLAAAASGSGKTTIAVGIIGALRRRGMRVAAAKVGPDFIDAAHLTAASGMPTRNFDTWLASPEGVRRSCARGAANAEITVIEGVMGLFDGRFGTDAGSTDAAARALDAPVVLVLDCGKASATVGAVALGLATYEPRLRVAGAILNRVASDKHAESVIDAVRRAGIPVLGIVRKHAALAFPERQLGLDAPTQADGDAFRAAAADAVEAGVDLDALLAIAADVPPIVIASERAAAAAPRVRIAVARDEAFWFYDEGSLDALRDAGAELVPYSPLRDAFPRDVDAAFIGGGYPELHAAALSDNLAARDGLRAAIAAGMPVYAECGGLMYLGEQLVTASGTFAMAGVVPATSTMRDKRSALRYVETRVLRDGPMFAAGEHVRGHEFHYSTVAYTREQPAYEIEGASEGFASAGIHASYVHVHLAGLPGAVARFVAHAQAYAAAAV
jgi:cobyrinic acid a,c-diamide synthase